MRVLVTGANGMLGQDLCPTFEKAGHVVIRTDIDNLDITDLKAVDKFFEVEKPDLVIHCAAYTNVDKAEEDFETAKLINVSGTENIAKTSQKYNSKLVYISTDYVFDGKKQMPYTPEDKANPLNNYGLTKFMGEEVVRQNCDKHYITRTSWLYGRKGRNFVETMLSIAKNPVVRVVDDQKGCPTWTMELVNGILQVIEKPFGTYHICGGGETTWYGFAKEIYKLTNTKVNLEPCETKDFPRPANRPHYSVMDNNGLCRDWKLALKDYIDLR